MKQLLKNKEWLITILFFIITPAIYYTNQLDPVLYSRYLALSIWLVLISIILITKAYKNNISLKINNFDKLFFGLGILFIFINIISSINVTNQSEAILKTFKELSFLIMMFYLHQMLRNVEWGKDTIIKAVLVM
jgi:hypothetical protein